MPGMPSLIARIERDAIGNARLRGGGGDRGRHACVVGGENGAIAVKDDDHRALGQRMAAQQIIEPVHIQRDRHAAVEAAIGLVQRAAAVPITGRPWPG